MGATKLKTSVSKRDGGGGDKEFFFNYLLIIIKIETCVKSFTYLAR